MLRISRFFIIFTVFLWLGANQTAISAAEEALESEATEAKAMCVLGKKIRSFPFYVYKDGRSSENHFYPSGNMGDLKSVAVDTHNNESPYSGSSCIKIKYQAYKDISRSWAGLYWQYPAYNWGTIAKAYDLTGAKKLTFWARGERGGEVISKFQVGGITGEFRDSGVSSIGPVKLSKQWRQYTIDLSGLGDSIIIGNEDKECWPFLRPLSRIIGGFCWATSMAANKDNGIVFYLDEIKFE